MEQIEFQSIQTNGVTLHTAMAGPEDGPLLILLHGFPEFWYGWKNQIMPLAEAGYRVVVPDQRGYHLSDKPEGIESYVLDQLRDDIVGLIKTLSPNQKAIVGGHDWGGAVAWHLASTRSQYVEKLIIVNMPHPRVMMKVLPFYPPQWKKSSYIAFFQLPNVPEAALQENHFQKLDEAIGLTARPHLFSKEDVLSYKLAWTQPGAMTSMLNWYRAIKKGGFEKPISKRILVPVRMIWGMEDKYLSRKLAKETMKICPNGQLIFVDDASHWINHEKPEVVNKLILEFLN
ncbi:MULTISPECIES: alpha/beta fold hydrolase [Bacillus]|uniref:alpha/beta fold hydrolase n=1 Tax=Bacillus TaxID=1386 RepID=UPI00145C2FAA|nr:alpha/beta hydrolase [Bacillus pumilus]MEB2359216.1 alpha/beta hydrolase [Bacillus pumilus]WLP60021.1 alpha/beta hydrolase [Bacillus pumilus]